MPCGSDSSSITTFTIMMLSIDQIITWIRFHLTIYSSISCARGRSFLQMYHHAIKYFDLSYFLSKRWNRITRLKHNDHTPVRHCMSHNRSHSSTISRESMTIHSYYLDTKEKFDLMLYFCPS